MAQVKVAPQHALRSGPTPAPGSPDRDEASDLANRLVTAVEAIVASKTASSASTKKAPSNGQPRPERGSKLEYKRVDEVWDERAGKYKVTESSDSESSELDQYVFVVRDRVDKNTLETTSFIDIKSPLLRDILRDVCQDMRSVSLADATPSVERHILFHIREELESRYLAGGPQAVEALRVLLEYVKTTYGPIQQHLDELLGRKEITYNLLWALFRPNAEVYATCRGTGAPRCVIYNHCEEMKRRDGSRYLHLSTRCLNSDGRVLGETTVGIEIDIFRGAKRIELLSAYPLEYHPEPDTTRRQLIEYGRQYVSLMGIHHRQYEGTAFYIDDEGEIVRRYIQGRIMVDAMCFQENKPNYPCPRVQKVRPKFSVLGQCATIKLENFDPDQLRENEFLICAPTVLGFCFKTKTFFEFAVSNISDVEWSDASFDDVKIPKEQKLPIQALTETYLKRAPEDGFKDFVQGKGRGINFLLHGPPGVGKTMTAEILAESSRIPLYTVNAGQIGVDPVKVDPILRSVFKIASRWRALLLFDEADVFLTQRSDNPQINALVSVLLRELEQYDGILFLTTNRLQAFDEAVLSRVHLALKYAALGMPARRAVWQYFLHQARTKQGPPSFGDDVIDDLANQELNGRDIRNLVFVAQSIAEYEGTVVNESHLKVSISGKRELQTDFQGVGAIENRNSYL